MHCQIKNRKGEYIMKAENFAKLIIEECLTKKGDSIKSTNAGMLYHLINHSTDKRRTFKWFNKGKSYKDTYIKDSNVLTKLGVDYHIDNDAPKGGKEGNYIIITEKGLRRIKPFLKEYHSYVGINKKDVSLKLIRHISNTSTSEHISYLKKIKNFIGECGLLAFEHGYDKQPIYNNQKIWGVSYTHIHVKDRQINLIDLSENTLKQVYNSLHDYVKYVKESV